MTLKYLMTGTCWIYKLWLGITAKVTCNCQKMLNLNLCGVLEEAIWLVSTKSLDLTWKPVLNSKTNFFNSELPVFPILKFALINYNVMKAKFPTFEPISLWFIWKNIFGWWVDKFIIKTILFFVMIFGAWTLKQWHGLGSLLFLTLNLILKLFIIKINYI